MSKFILIFTLIPAIVIFAQEPFDTKISGFVHDANTGEPLENVNVYISNTTFGAATDRDGLYIIKSVPPGIHELIISIVGYDFQAENILIKSTSDLKFNFKLSPRIYETQSTDIVGDIPYEWLENLRIFKKFFLGQTEFAEKCIIENEEILDFTWKKSNVLTASANQPLLIKNNALGFRMHCILTEFTRDDVLNNWSWTIKPVFYEMETSDPQIQKEWKENRQSVYKNSSSYFLVSMINNRLDEDSFAAYFVDYPGRRSSRRELLQMVELYDDLYRYDENLHEYILHFEDYICVVHDFREISWLKLNHFEVNIDSTGQPKHMNPFKVYGYWANLGIANSLPFYYKVENIDDD